jgi:hypothetical protein
VVYPIKFSGVTDYRKLDLSEQNAYNNCVGVCRSDVSSCRPAGGEPAGLCVSGGGGRGLRIEGRHGRRLHGPVGFNCSSARARAASLASAVLAKQRCSNQSSIQSRR